MVAWGGAGGASTMDDFEEVEVPLVHGEGKLTT